MTKLSILLLLTITTFSATVLAGPRALAEGDRSLTSMLIPNALKRLFDRSSEPAFQCNNPRIVGVANDVTVEAQLVLFKNGLTGAGDNKYNGEDCETLPLDDCDYKVKMFIDDENVFGRWPSSGNNSNFVTTMKMNSRRETLKLNPDKRSTNDNDYIFKACRHISSLSVVVIRLLILDEDTAAADEVVNQFNCYWAPSRLASNEAQAQWDEVNCCTALECDTARDAVHEARIRVRAYSGQGDCPDSGIKP